VFNTQIFPQGKISTDKKGDSIIHNVRYFNISGFGFANFPFGKMGGISNLNLENK
jgi:hypothetical protein